MAIHEPRRRYIRAYFARFPQLVIGTAALSLLIALASGGWMGHLVGVLGLASTGAITFYWFSLQPSDAQVDTWLREDLMNLQPRALIKGGLGSSDLVRDAVSVIGPRFRNLCGSGFGFRKGRDGRARFTPVDVTIINFTAHQLVVYQCALDLTTGKPLNECIDEYFYTDIVSVATKSDTFTYLANELDKKLLERIPNIKELTVEGKIQVNSAETFILSTSGGTSVRVVLNDPVLVRGLGGGELPLELAEQAVQAVRKMLREKKAGALPLRGAGF